MGISGVAWSTASHQIADCRGIGYDSFEIQSGIILISVDFQGGSGIMKDFFRMVQRIEICEWLFASDMKTNSILWSA